MTESSAPDTGEPIIRMRGVVKRFGDLTVLDGIDLDVARGEKISLIGASGSGKSTLLRILMTLEKPQSGDIYVAGEPLWHMEKSGRRVPPSKAHLRHMRRHVGMVFQHFNLFPHLTALQNVTLAPTTVMGLSKTEAADRGRALLDKVGLGDKFDVYPAQLSGGQKQRVAIARALAMQPDVMLFDEVTSALDPELVGDVLNVLRDLAHETDMTMLLVTHQMDFAREISDRVVFLDAGQVLEAAPPEVLYTNPREERTKQFLNAILQA